MNSSDPNSPIETSDELYEHAPCGYLSTYPDGRIARVNETFLNWTGFDRSDLESSPFQKFLSVGAKIFYETHFTPLLRMQGFVNEVAFDLICKDARVLPVLLNAVQTRDQSGRPLFHRVTIFNATERRRYERDLLEARKTAEQAAAELQKLNETLEQRVELEVTEKLKAEAALRQAQKMEAIGQLTGGVAHDFNNLLTIIIGNTELLLRHLPVDAGRLRRAADDVLQGAERAAILTQRLLAFARQQPLDPRPIDTNKLVFGMSDILRRTLGEIVVLETVLSGGVWKTRADANQLENAVLNLAVNARDAMPNGGRLTIETANAHLDEGYVAELAEPVAVGQYVLISVTDTGTGIDRATIGRVFEPFFTTKEAGKGTGLGLSQVYGFVRQSEGHIRVYSELGEGTTIKIYLPRYFGSETLETTKSSRPVQPLSGEGEFILVVEDEPDLRSYAVAALEEMGYRIAAAADGHEALRLLAEHPDIQLLFTDIVLPHGITGKQLADKAVAANPRLKVLFTSGYTRNAVVHNGRLDPGTHLIGKPFTFDMLASTVRTILDKA